MFGWCNKSRSLKNAVQEEDNEDKKKEGFPIVSMKKSGKSNEE